jgi:hypothetical protein
MIVRTARTVRQPGPSGSGAADGRVDRRPGRPHTVRIAVEKQQRTVVRGRSANRSLLAQIIEYHDATKHRHSVVAGQALDSNVGVSGGHILKPAPK